MALAPKRTLVIGGALIAVLVLYVLGSKQQPGAGSGAETARPAQCRVAVTADVLNIRATPTLDGAVVGKLSKGQESDADKVVQNGFRKLSENRWVSADFVKPLDGRDCG